MLDTDRSVSRAYGVYRLATLTSINVAQPAAFLIDRSGVVRYAFLGSRNRRPETDELLREAGRLH